MKAKFQTKVLMKCKWHYGIPDGENCIYIPVDDFEIEYEEEAVATIKVNLIQYGVNPTTLSFKERDFEGNFIFEAEIGRFDSLDKDHPRYPFIYKQLTEVVVSLSYLIERNNTLYGISEFQTEIPVINIDN